MNELHISVQVFRLFQIQVKRKMCNTACVQVLQQVIFSAVLTMGGVCGKY